MNGSQVIFSIITVNIISFQGIDGLIKLGYSLVIVTFLLMLWASYAGAKEFHGSQTALPCSFNPLCTCSQSAPDLGVVQCRRIPFPAIPRTVNDSKVNPKKFYECMLIAYSSVIPLFRRSTHCIWKTRG